METIKSRTEFEKVFSGGRRYNHQLVRITVLRDAGDEGDCHRVAFVAAKRLGNAVFRNRCKRVLREASRMCGLPVQGADVILFATRRTHDASPAEVSVALAALLRKAGVQRDE
ncbi:MAG: ribonuclease P protein component [Coriobacteriales bacterium]|nr:ribonuclease P protein component [Coriobacteriales bacterium]